MSGSKKKTPAEELIESLLKDMGGPDAVSASDEENVIKAENEDKSLGDLEGLVLNEDEDDAGFRLENESNEYDSKLEVDYELTNKNSNQSESILKISVDDGSTKMVSSALVALQAQVFEENKNKPLNGDITENATVPLSIVDAPDEDKIKDENLKTAFLEPAVSAPPKNIRSSDNDSDKTVAVAGYQVRAESNYDDKVKVSVGQKRMSSGYQAWNSGGSADSNLAQADNLRIAQEKIIELEQENEKLRLQNEELMSASDIIKERSDLLSVQLTDYRNDRDDLADSYKNEIVLLKNHLTKKDTELKKVQFKAEELDSRLKFDMKKIRVRERELENRLELIRAEKNAIVKNKDEQILDLRRKMDILQMEVESYRQKCVELNKSIESNQESFKRTTRALRLAMANLELQEENKTPLKKVD